MLEKEHQECLAEIGQMDKDQKVIKEQLKEANIAKRSAQRNLRLERSHSEEVMKDKIAIEIKLEAFNSNKCGYIERHKYATLDQEFNVTKEKLIHANKMIEAWKNQCGRI